MSPLWISAEWPAPANVRTCITTRRGGCSQGPWKGFNLGSHVGDEVSHVAANRAELQRVLGCAPAWLNQTHSTHLVKADATQVLDADASWTNERNIACTVMTADCLPVLFCNKDGTRVAAAHAGWRGLLDGILEQTIRGMGSPGYSLMAWLGPAIGSQEFEVGPEVRAAFISADAQSAAAFLPSARAGHYLADIYLLARQRLANAGVTAVYGGDLCTVSEPARYFSYRRDGQTGRFASLIWLRD